MLLPKQFSAIAAILPRQMIALKTVGELKLVLALKSVDQQ